MRARFIFHIWLVFLLLFAQGSALAHSISHFSEPLPFQSKSDKQLPHGPACDKCMFYADMAGSIPVIAGSIAVPSLDSNPDFLQFESFASVVHSFYSSRAPPVLA